MSRIDIRFNDELDELSVPAPSAFTVDDATANTITVVSVEIKGRIVTIVTDIDTFPGIITISYTKPARKPISTLTGFRADSFSRPFKTDIDQPIFIEATITSNVLVITYNEELDATSVPANEAFTVSRYIN